MIFFSFGLGSRVGRWPAADGVVMLMAVPRRLLVQLRTFGELLKGQWGELGAAMAVGSICYKCNMEL